MYLFASGDNDGEDEDSALQQGPTPAGYVSDESSSDDEDDQVRQVGTFETNMNSLTSVKKINGRKDCSWFYWHVL